MDDDPVYARSRRGGPPAASSPGTPPSTAPVRNRPRRPCAASPHRAAATRHAPASPGPAPPCPPPSTAAPISNPRRLMPCSALAPADRPAPAVSLVPMRSTTDIRELSVPGAPYPGGAMTQTSQRPLRVLAAMSGGVDSAVAAARAAEAGHDVTGVHLALSANPQSFRTGARGCCTIEDSRDARRAADVIGIPFYVWDLAERFREDVVEDFIAEYEAGRTPNPCLRCNEKIKFAALLDKALALGFDAVCTGHYATVVLNEDGTPRAAPRLRHGQGPVVRPRCPGREAARPRDVPARRHPHHQGRDPRRGRAPVAWPSRRSPTATTSASSPTATPRASWPTASAARPRATSSTSPATGSAPTRAPSASPSASARACASATPAADGKPRYVLDISPVNNTVTVGPVEALDVTALTAIKPRWCGTAPAGPGTYTAQLRAHGGETEVTAELVDGTLNVTFTEPVRGVAPGQAIVLYDGTRVVGSATIATTVGAPKPRSAGAEAGSFEAGRARAATRRRGRDLRRPADVHVLREELRQHRCDHLRCQIVCLARQRAVPGARDRFREDAGQGAHRGGTESAL